MTGDAIARGQLPAYAGLRWSGVEVHRAPDRASCVDVAGRAAAGVGSIDRASVLPRVVSARGRCPRIHIELVEVLRLRWVEQPAPDPIGTPLVSSSAARDRRLVPRDGRVGPRRVGLAERSHPRRLDQVAPQRAFVAALRDWLGYASSATTLNLYVNLSPGDEDRIRQAVDQAVALASEDRLRTDEASRRPAGRGSPGQAAR